MALIPTGAEAAVQTPITNSSASTAYGMNSRLENLAKTYGINSPDSANAWFNRVFDPSGYDEAYSQYQSALEREFNAEQAQINRDWQEKMSNTAYQRAVKDMQAAGLNPLLAYQQGGASTGSGSTASTGSGSRASQRDPLGFFKDLLDGVSKIVGGLSKTM